MTVAAGAHGVDAVRAVVDGADDEGQPPSDRELADEPRNDYGNGRRLIARHGRDLRAVGELQRQTQDGWIVWDGLRWSAEDGWAEAQKRAHQTAGAIADEADAIEADGPPRPKEGGEPTKEHDARVKRWEKRIEAQHKWAVASGNASRVTAMLSSAAPYLRVRRRDLDADPLLLACANGTLELSLDHEREAVLRRPQRGDLITHTAAVPFEAEAECPMFRAFLSRVLPDDEVRTFVQRWFGYCLTGYASEQLLALFYGRGANGKSTLLNIVRGVLGDYAATLQFASLTHDPFKRGGDATPDTVRLPGRRMVMASEPEVGTELSESTIKEQTGGEPIAVRPLFGAQFEFLPTHKLVLSFNNKPKVKANDDGTWRRLAMVHFGVQIPPGERDKLLAERIIAQEAAGVLNWMIDGFYLWREQGLAVPEAVQKETEEYRASGDPLRDFLTSCTRVPESWEQKRVERASSVYEAYQKYCSANAVEPISKQWFGRLIQERDGVEREKVGGVVYYRGFVLRDDLTVDGGEGNSRYDAAPPHPGHDD